ncbi:MAG: sulfatase [Candidatus Eisenbacteria sp.]|nr:sulfatase [Candidatus Eisenbacteria bacterium]
MWIVFAGLIVAVAAWWFLLRTEQPPNIVLITLESVRPDHLGCGGCPQAVSPAVDALAEEAMIYDDAHAVTSWTLPTHASIFTGLYPTAHQTTGPFSRLEDNYTTLAEILSEKGYQCGAVISGPYLKTAHGLHQGFEYYNESASALSQSSAHADVTCPQMETGLRHFLTRLRDPERPFFLFAYFWDPHYDYIPPQPYDRMFVTEDCEPIDVNEYEKGGIVTSKATPGEIKYIVSQYDGEIRWTDHHLHRFFQLLKAQGLWDNTVVIVTSDHGEEFYEHDWKGHKNNLYVEAIHVPLVIKFPGSLPRGRDSRLVSQLDLFPTILDLAGAESPGPHQGRSLLESVPAEGHAIYHELLTARYFPKEGGGWEQRYVRNWYGVREGEYKLVTVAEERRTELYNVADDPRERANIIARDDVPKNRLMGQIQLWNQDCQAIAKAYGSGGDAQLDEDALENLRSLGYIQ